MTRPTDPQMAALVLAMSDGYLRPASPTHAKRCRTTTGRLGVTAKSCAAAGWLKAISGGRYTITDAGQEFVPNRPVRTDEGWGF